MNGIIVVNKEKGYTSRDVVNIVGKHLGTKKIQCGWTLKQRLVDCFLKGRRVNDSGSVG